MELENHKQKKSQKYSKPGIFNQIKDGDSVRQDQFSEKIEDQKIESFGDVQPLIEKGRKWWMLSRKQLICSIAVVLFIVLGSIFYFAIHKRNDNKNKESPYIDDNKQVPYSKNDIYDLVTLNSSSALCLDGTPGTYYISRSGDPNHVYIHFEAGGWCGDADYEKTLQTCSIRSKTGIGSSKFNSPTVSLDRGIFSQDDRNYFKDWKKVFFSYCDGSGHQGTRKDPIKYKDNMLYFRGHNLTTQRLQSLQERIGLFSKAKRIVVSGQSAGGPASLYWSNYIDEKAKDAKVYAFPSSGIFYDSMNQTNNYDFRDVFINIMNITNQQIDHPLSQCVKQNPNDKYKCMFVQYMHQYVKVPMFFLQSLYDSFSIPVIIGIKCDENFAYRWPIIKNCKEDKIKIVGQYRKNVSDLLKQIAKDNKNGVWAVDCTGHGYMNGDKFFSPNFEVPQLSGNQISKTFSDWIENKPGSHVFIDDVQWPNNKPCNYDAF